MIDFSFIKRFTASLLTRRDITYCFSPPISSRFCHYTPCRFLIVTAVDARFQHLRHARRYRDGLALFDIAAARVDMTPCFQVAGVAELRIFASITAASSAALALGMRAQRSQRRRRRDVTSLGYDYRECLRLSFIIVVLPRFHITHRPRAARAMRASSHDECLPR